MMGFLRAFPSLTLPDSNSSIPVEEVRPLPPATQMDEIWLHFSCLRWRSLAQSLRLWQDSDFCATY